MREPILSVIIPAYNYAKFVGRAIDSVLEQGVNEIEVLVINDGSTDNTAEVLSEYEARGDRRLRVIHQQNAGLGAVRNRGIEESIGEFITFMDADDEMIKGSLSEVLRICEETDAGVVVFGHEVEFDDGSTKRRSPRKFSSERKKNFVDYLNGEFGLSNGPTLIRKTAFGEKTRYSTRLVQNEDLPVFGQLLSNNEFKSHDFTLIRIHRHDGSMRNDINKTRQVNVEFLADLLFDASVLPASLMCYRKDFVVRMLLSQFRRYFKSGAFYEARQCWWKAFKLSPLRALKKKHVLRLLLTLYRWSS